MPSFTVNRVKFLEACQRAKEAAGDSKLKPILGCLIINAQGKALTVRATNLEQEVVADCAADVTEEGVVAVDGHSLCAALTVLNDQDVSVEETDKGARLRLYTKMSEYKFAITREAYPPEFTEPKGLTFSLKAALLKESISWTMFSVDEYTSKNWRIDGLLLDVHKGTLFFVGIGKLAMTIYDTRVASAGKGKFIVPRKTFTMIQDLLATLGEDDPVTLEADARAARFTAGNSVVSTRLLEGKPPPWEKNDQIVYTKKAVMPADELQNAVARAKVMLADKFSVAVVDVSEGELSLSCNGSGGSTHIELACQHDADFKFKVAPILIGDMLKVAGRGKEATIQLADELYPLRVTLGGADYYRFQQALAGDAPDESAGR